MRRLIYSLAALVLCAPLAAQAAEGWVVADISLQAGPDPTYPSITELTAGTPVSIQGCIDGWTWCDVAAGYDRGWVPGTFLEEDYGGRRVVVIDYGPQVAIPIVSFSLGLYWDRHYHDRPFYTQREQWVAKAVRPSAPPRPAATAVARTTAPAGSAQSTNARQTATTQQRNTATQQPRSRVTARATAPQRPDSVPAPKTPSAPTAQPGKPEAAEQATTVAKAKPRAGEPKPKDELKKAKPKDNKDDHRDQSGGDNEH